MFLRCERCRAIYELESPPSSDPIVACNRCAHVFVARFAVTELGTRGTSGGAAAAPAPAIENAIAPPPPAATLARLQPKHARSGDIVERTSGLEKKKKGSVDPEFAAALGKRRSPTIPIALVALVVIGGAAWAWRHQLSRAARDPLAADVQAKLDGAEKLLYRDDAASLEQAIAQYEAAAALAPEYPRLLAQSGFATILAGASLKSEAADLNVELVHLDRQYRTLGNLEVPDPVRRAAVAEQMADVRTRIAPATARAEKLVREGLEKVKKVAAMDDMDEQIDVLRGLALFNATMQDADKIETIARKLDAEDPWIDYARGYARTLGRGSAQKAAEARKWLEAAQKQEPRLIRAKHDLARLSLAMNPPELERADGLLKALQRDNPDHEGARRGLELVELLRNASDSAAIEASAPTADLPIP